MQSILLRGTRNSKEEPRKIIKLISETKTELTAMNSRTNNAEEQTSDLEARIREITQSGQQTESQMKKMKIGDLCDNLKHANLCI